MATFDSAQRSQRTNRPVSLYTITTHGAVYRFTTNALQVTFGGVTYPALTVTHDDVQLTGDAAGDELVIHLPISHPFVQRFAATGIPEQSVQVTVRELQTAASEAALTWSGPGQSLVINGHTAALRVPSTANDALRIQLPTIAAQKICNHVLYDKQCSPNPGGTDGGPVRGLFQIELAVLSASADGLTLTVGTFSGYPDQYFRYGTIELETATLTPSGEVRTIISQVANVITIDVPFVVSSGSMAGQLAVITAGCDHQVTTCRDKFANVVNFGGMPQMNASFAPWSPGAGLSVVQQP